MNEDKLFNRVLNTVIISLYYHSIESLPNDIAVTLKSDPALAEKAIDAYRNDVKFNTQCMTMVSKLMLDISCSLED